MKVEEVILRALANGKRPRLSEDRGTVCHLRRMNAHFRSAKPIWDLMELPGRLDEGRCDCEPSSALAAGLHRPRQWFDSARVPGPRARVRRIVPPSYPSFVIGDYYH